MGNKIVVTTARQERAFSLCVWIIFACILLFVWVQYEAVASFAKWALAAVCIFQIPGGIIWLIAAGNKPPTEEPLQRVVFGVVWRLILLPIWVGAAVGILVWATTWYNYWWGDAWPEWAVVGGVVIPLFVSVLSWLELAHGAMMRGIKAGMCCEEG